jgi:hypothetical protein
MCQCYNMMHSRKKNMPYRMHHRKIKRGQHELKRNVRNINAIDFFNILSCFLRILPLKFQKSYIISLLLLKCQHESESNPLEEK